ncbi:MAG: hypothetical protein HYX75_08490 [Acidobacteria bacterium]|nr:hypothetical protein [Acidobacteriota bacterium]
MAKLSGSLLAIGAVLFLGGTEAAIGNSLKVSGGIGKINEKVRIAVNPVSGDALVTWSQGDRGDNEFGRVYAADLRRRGDGTYACSAPFLISPDSGSHQRPLVVYLAQTGTYLVVWDTAYRDLGCFLTLDPVDDRPFRSSDVLVRTYTPPSSVVRSSGHLGRIIKLNAAGVALAAMPFAVAMPAPPRTLGGPVHDDVFVTYLGSNEGGRDGKHWVAGMWGAQCGVTRDGDVDLAISRNVKMTSWEMIGAALSGFLADGKIYAGGVKMDFDESGVTGRGGVLMIDPAASKVERFVITGTIHPRSQKPADRAFGEVIRIDDASPAGSYAILSASNMDFNVRAFRGDLAAESFKKLGPLAPPSTLVDQRFFSIRDPLSEAQQAYALYHNEEHTFAYRSVSPDSIFGMPKQAFGPIVDQLQWMDVGVYGRDVLVVWAERKTNGRTEICFEKFRVE